MNKHKTTTKTKQKIVKRETGKQNQSNTIKAITNNKTVTQ